MSRRLSGVIIGRSVFVGALAIASAGFMVSSASALTYSSDVDVSFTFNSVISVQLSSANIYINNLAPGTASDSNIITVGANTNASAGFQLSATVGVKNGTTALVNNSDNNYTFTNLSSTKAALANFSDNTWGYSYCANTAANCNGGSGTWVSGNVGSAVAGYNGLPLDNNTNADERGKGGVTLISTTGTQGELNTVQFKIGAKASNSQVAGTYTNTINFYAVANPEPELGPVDCVAGKVCYNVNALYGAEGTMGQQTATADGTELVLLASNFSRPGYGFAGWSDTYDYSGNKYGPNETITVPTGTASNGLSLYAIWVKSAGSIQNWSGCSGLASGAVTALTDQRDNNTYAVAKLADGKCWMIENLRLESTANGNSDGSLAQGYGTSATYGNFSGLATAETANFANSTTANSLYYSGTQSGTASVDIGTTNYPGNRVPRYSNANTSARASNPTTKNAALYSYGNYYTWSAAIADTTYYNTNNQSITTTSLCPAGWRLPRGGDKNNESNNDFWSLIVDGINNGTDPANYSSENAPYYDEAEEAAPVSTALRTYPNNFVYPGLINGGNISGRGSGGYYWSSTVSNNDSSTYRLYFVRTRVYPGTSNVYKYAGLPMRCMVGS
ncbi:hypothetical protein IKG38_02155 [Candidatus Saccharibacteria bacterium]|nr:hypothetical protein [Candidatus Saccharibacteria bacterium]